MGRVFQPTYTMIDKATGLRVKRISPNWSVEFTDNFGRCVRRSVGTSKEQARDVLRKLESETLSEKFGLPTRKASGIPSRELLQKYMQSLYSQVATPHCRDVESRLKRFLKESRLVLVKDLTPEAVEGFLNDLEKTNLAPHTINVYLQSIKGMLNWAVRTRLLPYNPVDCVQMRRDHEKRRVRRALSDVEISQLLIAALDGPRRRAMKRYQNRPRKDGSYKSVTIPLAVQAQLAEEGRNIELAYRIMLETGLRVNECKLLTWADVDLDGGTFTTRPEWVGNKNGKRETLPLAPGLWEKLKSWKTTRKIRDIEPIVKITDRTLRQFDEDLVAAGIAKCVPVDKNGTEIPINEAGDPVQKPAKWKIDKRDAAGRIVDLHALRHTFGTRLGSTPGIDPKSVQTLMRHSTPDMTFRIYVHSDKGRLKTAVSLLPALGTQMD